MSLIEFMHDTNIFRTPIGEKIYMVQWWPENEKVIDYVLVEPFVQQYIKNCEVRSDFDFESDHRLIIASIETPKTRKARRSPKKVRKPGKLDLNALKDIDTEQLFTREVTCKINDQQCKKKTQ